MNRNVKNDWHFVSLTDREQAGVLNTLHVHPGSLMKRPGTEHHRHTGSVYWVTNLPICVLRLDWRTGLQNIKLGHSIDWNVKNIFFIWSLYLCIPPLAAIRVDPQVVAGHVEGSHQTDGEPLVRRFIGFEDVIVETRGLLSILQYGQPGLVSTVKPGNIRLYGKIYVYLQWLALFTIHFLYQYKKLRILHQIRIPENL